MKVRVYLYLAEEQYIELLSPILRTDGSGIFEGYNKKTGNFCLIKDWSYAVLLHDESKPVKIVEKKNPLKRDDA